MGMPEQIIDYEFESDIVADVREFMLVESDRQEEPYTTQEIANFQFTARHAYRLGRGQTEVETGDPMKLLTDTFEDARNETYVIFFRRALDNPAAKSLVLRAFHKGYMDAKTRTRKDVA